MEEEQVSLRPFWGVAEVLGVLAAIAPFVITASSMTMETANGVVTKYVFRDWVAVGGGAVAILCAIGVAARWKGTLASKKPLRGAIAAVAVALGAFHLLRGLGIIGQPAHDEAPRPPPVVQVKEPAPPPADKPAVDLVPGALDFVAKWQAGKLHEIYAAAAPALRENVTEEKLNELFARVTAAVGACKPPTGPFVTSKLDDPDVWAAKTVLTCEHAQVSYRFQGLVQHGAVTLFGADLDVDDPKIDHADAVATGDRLLAALLADDAAAVFAELDPRVIANLNNDQAKLRDGIADALKKAGKPGKTKRVTSTEDGKRHQLVYDVAASRYHLTATFTVEFFMARWFVTDFDLSPAKAK